MYDISEWQICHITSKALVSSPNFVHPIEVVRGEMNTNELQLKLPSLGVSIKSQRMRLQREKGILCLSGCPLSACADEFHLEGKNMKNQTKAHVCTGKFSQVWRFIKELFKYN